MYGLTVDRGSDLSIARQLTGQLRALILNGALSAGTRLPATRALASELGIARNVAIEVYEQLISEGYLAGRAGSGTYVEELEGPADAGRTGAPEARKAEGPAAVSDVIRFETGVVDHRLFPRAAWARAMRDAQASLPDAAFARADSSGDPALREALSAYLYRAKDILCDPRQIAIVPGATCGADVVCRALKNSPVAAVEDPCVDFMRDAFSRNGISLLPIPVDAHGMRVELLSDADAPGYIYVVPSHQFPTGGVLAVRRRLELLRRARRCGATIIEDDYDSEFRYGGEPIQTLRHLDPARVVYLGSFSKIFSPSLRMGYLILPWEAVEPVRAAMEAMNLSVPILLQRAMAEFLSNGQLTRHIYKMKRAYAAKRGRLIGELLRAFGERVIIRGENAGLHVMISFADRPLRRADFDALRAHGVFAEWSEDYALEKGRHESGMILGYGDLSEAEIARGVSRLKAALDDAPSR